MIVKVLMNSISTTKNSTYEVCACMLSRLSLCNPKNYSLLGSSVHRISQARILGWMAISRDHTWGSCIAGGLLHWGWPPTLQVDSLLTEPSRGLQVTEAEEYCLLGSKGQTGEGGLWID